ncbi:MAG: hypothetical protein H0W25_01810 [Acidimicrobiia bacterium]|nr:hypothetical protein [Acidimicrobiia bacterium]
MGATHIVSTVGSLPQPPEQLTMSLGWERLYTGACLMAFLAMSANAFRLWRAQRDTIPLLLIAGGALCVFLEPMVDVLGLCWYPRGSSFEIFELLGRPIPFLVLPGYTFFMGGLTVIALHRLEVVGPKGLLQLYPVMILLELPFEILAVRTEVYVYYGQQPLRIIDFPVWWLFVNTMVPVIAAVLLRAMRPWLVGPVALIVIPFLPAVDAGVNAALAWPTWTVLNSDVPTAVTQLAGLLTCGMAVGALVLLVRALEGRLGPAAAAGTTTPDSEREAALR